MPDPLIQSLIFVIWSSWDRECACVMFWGNMMCVVKSNTSGSKYIAPSHLTRRCWFLCYEYDFSHKTIVISRSLAIFHPLFYRAACSLWWNCVPMETWKPLQDHPTVRWWTDRSGSCRYIHACDWCRSWSLIRSVKDACMPCWLVSQPSCIQAQV